VRFRDGPFVNHQYDKENTIFVLRSGELTHPRTGKPVVPVLRPRGRQPALVSPAGAGAGRAGRRLSQFKPRQSSRTARRPGQGVRAAGLRPQTHHPDDS
jgi:hypothetical protein